MPNHERVYREAHTVISEFLRLLDASAPGAFPAAYVVGGLAMGDAQPGQSDIDLLLVRRLDVEESSVVSAVREAAKTVDDRYDQPKLDGMVVSENDLRDGPLAMNGGRIVFHDGSTHLRDSGSLWNPTTWSVLRDDPITWRGPALDPDGLWYDPEELRRWVRENLSTYWHPWLARSRFLTSPFGAWSLKDDFVAWGVLGVARMAATLETGTAMSKTDGGNWALHAYDERWHQVIREALDIRTNRDRSASLYAGRTGRLHRRRDARAFIAMVLSSLDIEAGRPKVGVRYA